MKKILAIYEKSLCWFCHFHEGKAIVEIPFLDNSGNEWYRFETVPAEKVHLVQHDHKLFEIEDVFNNENMQLIELEKMMGQIEAYSDKLKH